MKNTIDHAEVEKFSKLSSQWWDPNGSLKALHSMNSIRIPLIESTIDKSSPGKKRLLDIGCGGGFLSEGLGVAFKSDPNIEIVGMDPSQENITIAQNHLPSELKTKVTYICDSIENYVAQNPFFQFDTVIMSEVIEHVDNPEEFLKYAVAITKPGGSIILTTPGKTIFSYTAMILFGEYILRIVPIGTHEYGKFVSDQHSIQMLQSNDCTVKDVRGSFYNPITNSWRWTWFKSFWYAIHAVKNELKNKPSSKPS